MDTITIRSPDHATEAQFVPSANMVCCSLRHRGLEFLDLGRGLETYASQGKTMGIPLLHPWANRLEGFEYGVGDKHVVLPHDPALIPIDGQTGLPIHGVQPALMHWEVEQRRPDSLAARMRWDEPPLIDLFPFPHELTIESSVGPGKLTTVTALAPLSTEAVPVSFGYHPYFRIPDAPRNRLQVTLGVSSRLPLNDSMVPTGERAPVAERELQLNDLSFDDAFEALENPAEFTVSAGAHTLTVTFQTGFSFAQVYAPADKNFICCEPMTAPTNALNSRDGLRLVKPGDTHRAAFSIEISG